MALQDLLKNPMTEWLFWLIRKSILERRNKGLRLHYLAKAHGCHFGKGNVVKDRSLLVGTTLGDYTYVSQDCLLDNVSVGKFCSIGPYTRMGLGLHPAGAFVSTHPAFYSMRAQAGIHFADKEYFTEKAPIEIGHDVWIGANVIIKDGVKIGHGAVIAAGAVVSADVSPYAIVGGVPAKVIRSRFTEDVIAKLLAASWWDKDPEWLRKHYKSFHDVNGFLK
jgi:acetyltransferase-like isoleucine patch superfamily enzyme